MKKAIGIVGFVVLALVLYECAPLRQFSSMRAWMTGSAAKEILVGVSWPFALNEDGMDEGLILAQDELNGRGGVLGKRIRLLMRDDHMDRREARTIAREFARNPQMVATIGYYDDKFAVRASAIFEESHLLHIVAGANNTYMTTHGFQYLIRSVLANDKIGRSLASMGMARGLRRFAILAEEGAFGEDLADQVGRALDAMGGRVVYQSLYVPESVEFRQVVDDLRGVDTDAILFLGFERENATFIKAARTMGLTKPIVGAHSDTPLMHSIAGNYLEGEMFYEIYDVDSPTSENRAFVARYRDRFGKNPDAYASQGYDSLRILAQAIQTTGSTDCLDLSWAIRFMDRWEGANGPYKFTPTGELEDKDIVLKVYRGGKPVVIERSHAGAQAAKQSNEHSAPIEEKR